MGDHWRRAGVEPPCKKANLKGHLWLTWGRSLCPPAAFFSPIFSYSHPEWSAVSPDTAVLEGHQPLLLCFFTREQDQQRGRGPHSGPGDTVYVLKCSPLQLSELSPNSVP